MNSALKWKLIAGFLLVFLAGGLTGAFVAAKTTRHFLFAASHHEVVAQRMRARLQAQLGLTPEQMAKISPPIDKAAAQLEQIRRDTARRVHETFAEAHEQIAKDLTPEQKVKLEQLRERHHRWLHRLHPGRDRPRVSPSPSPASSPL
jgi:Spy/CpxP family protein refolding chaperone